MIKRYHVNFHTANSKPVFLAEAEQTIRRILRDVMKRHRIPCILSEVMPTHVHLILIDFADMDIGRSLYLLKGASAHEFLKKYPEFRRDLGDHLWDEGYSWREITSHRQFVETVAYVHSNRPKDRFVA